MKKSQPEFPSNVSNLNISRNIRASMKNFSKEQIIPDSLIETIQHGGKPEIYLKGFVGREMQELPHW